MIMGHIIGYTFFTGLLIGSLYAVYKSNMEAISKEYIVVERIRDREKFNFVVRTNKKEDIT